MGVCYIYVNVPCLDVRGRSPWPSNYAANLWMRQHLVNTSMEVLKGRIIQEKQIQTFEIASQRIVKVVTICAPRNGKYNALAFEACVNWEA